MLNRFRTEHLFAIFATYEKQNFPLDRCLNQYFRANKSIGSKDRAVLGDIVYTIVRYRNLFDHFSSAPFSWEKRYLAYTEHKLPAPEDLPPHLQHGFPETLFDLLSKSYGSKAIDICKISNERAPLTIRANPIKTTREKLLSKLEHAVPCDNSPLAIKFTKKTNLLGMSEFKNGLFEIQDEGSQRVSELVEVEPGDELLDFCAGAGGKAIAFAHKMEGKGTIHLYDLRSFMLKRAEKRLNRAGVKNIQLIENKNTLQKLKGKMDWIVLDVPCSGSGTLRRNPDLKWQFSLKKLQSLVEQQRAIFKEAIQYLKPSGKIVYITCSLLPAENEEQVAYFKKTYNLEVIKQLQILPEENGSDGFFAIQLQHTKS